VVTWLYNLWLHILIIYIYTRYICISHSNYRGSERESQPVANIAKLTPINSLYAQFTIEYANKLIEEKISTKLQNCVYRLKSSHTQ
jgi:hypothetical protein